ncbi:MAG: IS66 family transposase [Bacteroides sp.]|jgi:hypothetical protein|nr:IS66 family transposase [Bacteroides sp.]MCI1683835.1 IS66 family transposase [Bacteroides sp.]
MEFEEIANRKFYREQLEQSDEDQTRLPISCEDMSDSEKASFIDFMAGMVKEKSLRNAELQKTIDRQGERLDGLQASLDTIERMLKDSRHENNQLNAQLTEQGKILTSLRVELSSNTKALEKARREVEKYKSLYEVLKTEKFGSPSQKHKRPDPGCGRDDAKDDWDGTPDDPATGETSSEELDTEVDLLSESSKDKQERAYRQGLKYERMNARVTVMHKCDRSRIPAGAQIIKTEIRSTFHTVNRMEEHRVEYITYRTKEGKCITAFFPMSKSVSTTMAENLPEEVISEREEGDEEEILKHFPGTHATVELLVELVFNKYMMETPVYREMIRLMELKFKVSRQTILNWLSKGAKALKKLIPVMKAQALEKNSIVNCDETWCRVKMQDKYKKAYIWCLVNKAAGIVIFFYDEGSRGRKVLTDFIGESELAALQSDAYNVYKYLDDKLTKVEHICCMAHVRAKFEKALEQGKDERAEVFVKWIGDLYKLEESYKVEHLSPDEIKRRRNSTQTTEIISNIWQELTFQLDSPMPKGDLLTKALNYLEHAWTPVMAYRNNGRYDIDNSIAERSIRPMTIERKNSIAFGSHNGAETSTIYHTFIATCKIGTLSFRSFLKKYFTAYMDGRTDYEHLTPAYLAESIK